MDGQANLDNQVRAALSNMGLAKLGENVRRLENTIKDTLFYGAGSSLTSKHLFQSNKLDMQYKYGYFPVPSQAFAITHLRIVPFLAFKHSISSYRRRVANLISYFFENSYLTFQQEFASFPPYWLHRGLENAVINNISSLPWDAYTGSKNKFASYDELDTPFVVGAGQSMDIIFVPAKNLTLADFDAALTPYFPENSGELSCDFGFGIHFYFRGLSYVQTAQNPPKI
jgi:hypothetical protein